MRKRIRRFLRRHAFTKKIYDRYAERRRTRRYRRFCEKYELSDKLIVFESFKGRKYVDSPKDIYEALINDERYKDYTFVWFFRSPGSKKDIPALRKAILVRYNSIDFYECYSRAKYIVSNSRLEPALLDKREGQIYIQTWHGTPLKKIGVDVEQGDAVHTHEELVEFYKREAEKITYMISPSAFCSEKLSSAFNLEENNPDAEMVEEGYPRNDFLFNYIDEDVYYAKKSVGIEKMDKKVILYAPTWRDNQYTTGQGFDLELPIDFDKLQEELGDEYVILFRAHYFVANSFDFSQYSDFILNVSDYEDINDLYIASDILVTDYSSVFFDYANLKRPMIFYMYDLEEYRDELRGFYISLDGLPGPIVRTEDELISKIKGEFTYDDKYKAFNDKYNYLDDGHATERVVERCFKEQ